MAIQYQLVRILFASSFILTLKKELFNQNYIIEGRHHLIVFVSFIGNM